MGHDTEIFVRIDIAKVRNAIAIADGEGAERRAFLESGFFRRKHASGEANSNARAGKATMSR
jgi:hypothetical protein